MSDRAIVDRVRYIPEHAALEKLGIETPCCVSCLAEESDTGEMPCFAYSKTVEIECCCTHREAIQAALDTGTRL